MLRLCHTASHCHRDRHRARARARGEGLNDGRREGSRRGRTRGAWTIAHDDGRDDELLNIKMIVERGQETDSLRSEELGERLTRQRRREAFRSFMVLTRDKIQETSFNKMR